MLHRSPVAPVAVYRADDIDVVKFQAFGTVGGHKSLRNSFGVSLASLIIANRSALFMVLPP